MQMGGSGDDPAPGVSLALRPELHAIATSHDNFQFMPGRDIDRTTHLS